jgi:ribonuclease G
MKTAKMSTDRAKHKILPPSRFGLIEITRQRVRPEMDIQTREENPDGSGKVEAPILIVEEIENNLDQLSQKESSKVIYLHIHQFIAAYLSKGFFSSIRRKWAKKYKKDLKITPRDSFKFLEYEFLNDKDEKLEFK